MEKERRDELYLKYLDLYEKKEQLLLEAGLSPTVIVTLKEQEADEVGFELYLRAGFEPNIYTFMYRHHSLKQELKSQEFSSSEDPSKILAECVKIREKEALGVPPKAVWTKQNEPYRIIPGRVATHPAPCWRIYNTLVNEMGNHRNNIDQLNRRPPPPISGPSLENVKESFKGLIN